MQWPSKEKLNCDRVQQCRIYTRETTSDFVLAMVVNNSMIRNAQLNNVDPFRNLTVGISFVNSAGLESDLVQVFYHGSMYCWKLSLCMIEAHVLKFDW